MTSLRDLIFLELLPVFAGSPHDLVVKANLTPGTVSDQSFSPCSWQFVSFTVVLTSAFVLAGSCRGFVDGFDVRTSGQFIGVVQRWSTGTEKNLTTVVGKAVEWMYEGYKLFNYSMCAV